MDAPERSGLVSSAFICFADCAFSKLTSLKVPAALTTIGNNAFYNSNNSVKL